MKCAALCRVALPGHDNEKKHEGEPFASAPYIHPFNYPKYHAQQLRSILFAKATHRRLLWVRAHDWPVASGDEDLSKDDLDRLRQNWLQLHDKATAGIMGLLPLVRGLPMRLTNTEDPEQHAYKNARCTLEGWALTPAEEARVRASRENELVLVDRPVFVKVKIIKPKTIATAADDENEGPTIFLQPRVREWSRDAANKAKVRRIGFPLVPEFGGTVHGYCGTTLRATQSDLLEWQRKPSREDMQKAYINESRVSTIDSLLIVQPYSPQLFRQGELPGPTILMQVLRGDLETNGAKRLWEQVEKDNARKQKDGEWPATMMLPCASCTRKNGGEEVRKRLCTFTSATKLEDMWRTIAKGQSLECIRCYQGRVRKITSGIIFCETCEAYRPETAFSSGTKSTLVKGGDGLVQCEACEHGKSRVKRAETRFEHCCSCDMLWPEAAFQAKQLQEWRANRQEHLMTCASCVVDENLRDSQETRECERCKRTLPLVNNDAGKHLRSWGPVTMRNFLDRGNNAVRWLCYTCVYPECNTCHQRPKFPLTGAVTAETYICETCIRPPCDGDGCNEPRPLTMTVYVARKWYCPKCRAKLRTCTKCGVEKSVEDFDRYKTGPLKQICRACDAAAVKKTTRVCATCGTDKPYSEFNLFPCGKLQTRCRLCETIKLTCSKCKAQKAKEKLHDGLCEECQEVECTLCGKKKPRRCFGTDSSNRPLSRCNDCQFTTCANCGAISKQRLHNLTKSVGDWYRDFL